MSKEQVRFTKTATTKAKNPRTWEITYTLVNGPAIKPKKPKKADEERESAPDAEEETATRRRGTRKKNDSQQSLDLDR